MTLLLVAVTTAVKIALGSATRADNPFFFYIVAVLIAAWWGGMRCGIAATLMSALAVHFLFLGIESPLAIPAWQDAVTGTLFVAEGFFVSWVVAILQRANEDRSRLLVVEKAARVQADAHTLKLRTIAGSLRENEERLRLIIGNSLEAVITADGSGRITGWNRQAENMSGWSAEEAIGRPLVTTIIPPQYRERFLAGWALFMETGEGPYLNRRLEFSAVHRDGHEFPVELSVIPAHVAGEVIFNAFIRDISERKKAEEELARHRERLEELVVERTHALRQSMDQLRRSERLASIGTLAAGVAHEINNPLNAILLTAECSLRLKQADGNAAVKETLEIISQEAQRGGRIVQGILKFAREEKTDKAPGDLNAVARSAVSLARTYCQPAALSVDLDLADALPMVKMNATEMEQVIINLVKNAAEAGQGGVHVVIQTRGTADGVQIMVKDDGPGIPEEQLPHIFDPFFSAGRNSGRTGMGLSIVHGIVHDHGGTAAVASRPGEGATFTVTLPPSDRIAARNMTRAAPAGIRQADRVGGEHSTTLFEP